MIRSRCFLIPSHHALRRLEPIMSLLMRTSRGKTLAATTTMMCQYHANKLSSTNGSSGRHRCVAQTPWRSWELSADCCQVLILRSRPPAPFVTGSARLESLNFCLNVLHAPLGNFHLSLEQTRAQIARQTRLRMIWPPNAQLRPHRRQAHLRRLLPRLPRLLLRYCRACSR